MSILLFSVGAIAFIAGIVMAGFGIPVSEFSFGNTLIIAGVTTAVGGLIIAGLGAVVFQLQKMAEALGPQAPIRPSRPVEAYDAATGLRAAPAAGRSLFPPKPKSATREQQPHAPASADLPLEDQAAQSYAPSLPNPDEPPVTVEDEVSLSPTDFGERAPPRPAPAQARQHSTYFDAMWPAETSAAKKAPAASEAKPERDLPPLAHAAAPPPVSEPEAPGPEAGTEPHGVAILKSGVVDGMAYTLYVDGSIEAELPQGTLRFASINELRSHLEKSS